MRADIRDFPLASPEDLDTRPKGVRVSESIEAKKERLAKIRARLDAYYDGAPIEFQRAGAGYRNISPTALMEAEKSLQREIDLLEQAASGSPPVTYASFRRPGGGR